MNIIVCRLDVDFILIYQATRECRFTL